MMTRRCCSLLMASLLLAVVVVTDAATQFNAPKGVSVVCADSLSNMCSAPTSCNRNGQVTLDSGDNFNIGEPSTLGSVWKISGGYKITFPVACNITCQGECRCDGCPESTVPDFDTTAVQSAEAPTSAATATAASIVVALSAVAATLVAAVL